ncbi:MAG: Lpg1974 family pore-forming outer membrane protein [Chlamydiota bacterium]
MRNSTLTFFAVGVAMFGSLFGGESKAAGSKNSNSACPGDFFLEADFLYWKMRQQGLDVFSRTAKSQGEVVVDGPNSVEENQSKGQYHQVHFDWEPGFRIGAGYDFKDCKWALSAFWTHLRGKGGSSHSHAKTHWSSSYNVLDLLVTGRPFHLGSSFTWKAFGGVKAAQIHQKFRASSVSTRRSLDPFSIQNVTLSTTDVKSKFHTDFIGIGPEIGVNGSWNLGRGFSVYANADGAILYSRYHSKFTDEFDDLTTFLSDTDPTISNEFISEDVSRAASNTCQAVIDLGLGFSWQRYTCLCHHSVGWVVKLGWEHTQWFDFSSLGSNNDLTLDGLVVSGQIQF